MTTIAYSYIRFSTPDQIKGDSLRRQLEQSQAYAAEHGLELDTTLNMRDLGVSAFRGSNVEKGCLGAFINAIETGKVKEGAYLLVESLDRISRESIDEAINTFLSIVRKGITIVTLVDREVYSRETIKANPYKIFGSIVVMARAHDESLTKSVRRSASWKQSKKLFFETDKKFTRKVPFWLVLPDLDGDYQTRPEAVETVRLIFQLAKAGLGYLKISQELNKRGMKSPAAWNYSKEKHKDRGWGTSSVAHILASEAVIGTYIDKTGAEPVVKKLHFPPIIDESLFYEVRPKLGSRGGRPTPFKTNLFTHRLFCGYCGSAMQVDAGKKDGVRRSNMICQRGRRGFGCNAKAWHYEEFEEAFFRFVREVDLSTLIGRKTGNVVLEKSIAELRGRIADNDARLAALINAIEEGEAPKPLMAALKKREADHVRMETDLKARQLELDEYLHCEERLTRGVQQVRELYDKITVAEDEERVLLRYAIADHIASIVDSIEVFSIGSTLALYSASQDEPHEPDISKSFTVKFKNGMLRLVKPASQWSMKLKLRKD